PGVVGPRLEGDAPHGDPSAAEPTAGGLADLLGDPASLLVIRRDHGPEQPEVVSGVLGDSDEGDRVLREAGAPVPGARLKEMGADSVIETHALDDVDDVGA